ncbi:M20/M25/M40 family metallo-hydrolase [Halorubrum vacuolatum]|uniref:Acetylornithine deacetylase n=1 Tax=Halorubrum vacuolatum TaxID=63740 RepID=A0A238VNJ3_HALVU|nr:M20/M25/M40 family metallo-hydrolase [Halorubrum vacuolatum]SNR35734.1 acetylornithine deacetylase [Halorubrum vacuolatum]
MTDEGSDAERTGSDGDQTGSGPDRIGPASTLRSEELGFDPLGFLADAVRIPSHEDVTAMRELVCDTLRAAGHEPSIVADGCIVAERSSPAPADGPHLVLNTHIDTVSPHVPFERGTDDQIDSPVIRGRGACDAKGPLAALIYAFVTAEPERGRLTLAITPDEELLSLGAATLLGLLRGTEDRLDADLVLVGEPTGLDVCTAAKGRFQGTVELSGIAAHAAETAGVNAIAAAEGALRAIRTFDTDAETHPQLGPPKLTPTLITGGSASNQVPAACSITVDRRSVPPETADGFQETLTEAVDTETPTRVGVDVTLTPRESPFFEAFATDPDHAFVADAVEAAQGGAAAVGLPDSRGGGVRPFGAATEASYFAPTPTVVFGPGDLADEEGPVAHAEREYVRTREVEAAALAVEHLIGRTLSATSRTQPGE